MRILIQYQIVCEYGKNGRHYKHNAGELELMNLIKNKLLTVLQELISENRQDVNSM